MLAKLLGDGLGEVFAKHGVAQSSTYAGSMLCTFFNPEPVHDLESALRSDTAAYAKYFHSMLDRGVLLWGELRISVADVDLIEVGLKLMLASTRTADAWRLTTAQRAAGPPGERR